MSEKEAPNGTGQPAPPRHDIPALLARLDRRLRLEAARGGMPAAVEPPAGWHLDGKGRMVPARLLRAQDGLEDQTVRRILAFAVDLADRISRFRKHTYDNVATFLELLTTDEYGGGKSRKKPGRRGNFSLTSYDGRLKVVIQVQDQIIFGPELQAAREIIDGCIEEWSNGAGDEIRAIVQHAFQPDKQGKVNREAVLRLRRLDIDDDRWRQARRAIDDSIRIQGSKAYLRLYLRGSIEGDWKPVPIDIAVPWEDTDALDAPAGEEA